MYKLNLIICAHYFSLCHQTHTQYYTLFKLMVYIRSVHLSVLHAPTALFHLKQDNIHQFYHRKIFDEECSRDSYVHI